MQMPQLAENKPYTMISPERITQLGAALDLPDGGHHVKDLADGSPGGALNPVDLETISADALGYRASWAVVRFPYYGFEWDITGLRLESLNPAAKKVPWIVIVNGGSANFYEFFLDPLNAAGLGQYLAQKVNVLLVTIPGNFKYDGWTVPPDVRAPQYLLDREIDADEIKVRNAVYSNKMEIEGLKRLIKEHTFGDILIVGHSTSGELAFLSMGDAEIEGSLKGRFLGWGSGGPSNLRKEWEESVGIRKQTIDKLSKYPSLWELRSRGPEEYVGSGYIGPMNPCARPGMDALAVARRWLSLVERRRPNFKQVLQDMEHSGMVELKTKIEAELNRIVAETNLSVDMAAVLEDMFATNHAPLNAYRKMVWVVGKWDRGHWHKDLAEKARELTIANQFRNRNPSADIRILVMDLPMTHYGHIERPRAVAGSLIAAAHWLAG